MTPQSMAHALRILAIDTIEKAQSGHPGLPLGMADVMTVLWTKFLVHDPENPTWPNRDRFILSAGHGCALLYGLLHLTGYAHPKMEDLQNFRQHQGHCHGHPERGPGIEVTTGPLGQGLANGVGMALAQKIAQEEFPFLTHRTYVLVSDGDLMEGIAQEAISLAGHWRLNKLVVLFDDNNITIDGPCDLSRSEDTLAKFRACGWDTFSMDGHNLEVIEETLTQVLDHQTRPVLIACKTHIGWGCPSKQGTCQVHGSPLGAKAVAETRAHLNWLSNDPFVIPTELLNQWRQAGRHHRTTADTWHATVQAHALAQSFWQRQDKAWSVDLSSLRTRFFTQKPHQSTRKSSGQVLQALGHPQWLLPGSADLAQSTQILPGPQVFSADNPGGHSLHYGVREHAMAGIMNGLAAYGGFVPCGGTFFVFSDYSRAAIRLSALMGLQVIHIMTHDSIGLGQDGPTHQPIEHLASFRAMPGIHLFRPADALETLECWDIALSTKNRPSLLVLSRQDTPCIRQDEGEVNLCTQGAYVVHQTANIRVDIWATGTEVALGLKVIQWLTARGIGGRLISMPCWSLFDQQPQAYRESLMKNDRLKVSIEAASSMGWERYVGQEGLIFSLDRFGASGAYEDLYAHFHLTEKHIGQCIQNRLSSQR